MLCVCLCRRGATSRGLESLVSSACQGRRTAFHCFTPGLHSPQPGVTAWNVYPRCSWTSMRAIVLSLFPTYAMTLVPVLQCVLIVVLCTGQCIRCPFSESKQCCCLPADFSQLTTGKRACNAVKVCLYMHIGLALQAAA